MALILTKWKTLFFSNGPSNIINNFFYLDLTKNKTLRLSWMALRKYSWNSRSTIPASLNYTTSFCVRLPFPHVYFLSVFIVCQSPWPSFRRILLASGCYSLNNMLIDSLSQLSAFGACHFSLSCRHDSTYVSSISLAVCRSSPNPK